MKQQPRHSFRVKKDKDTNKVFLHQETTTEINPDELPRRVELMIHMINEKEKAIVCLQQDIISHRAELAILEQLNNT